ncbi:flagellar filament capping protein FliD [Clostridium sp. MB05]|uniref:flagellar filament capping protein FliD n=1 Tax=Clostridium sp. MB05 TaxID=3376682 RepID=UPI0039820477
MRVTGLATGLDMDQIVKDSMKPYRIKIDRKGQEKEILEIKQKLYREVLKDSREFYNKYFDVNKKDSMLLTQNWSTVKLKSSNEDILTVTGGSDAKAENYTITGTTATAAKMVITAGIAENDKLVINGKDFILKGSTEKERANNLNRELKESGINVSVRYSDFAGTEAGNVKGFIFESTVLGKDSTFTIGGSLSSSAGIKVDGKNATAATITGFKASDFNISGTNTIKLTIDGEEKSIAIDGKSIEKNDASGIDNEKLQKVLNESLKEYKLSAVVDVSGDITFKSTVLGKDVVDPSININSKTGSFKLGEDATFSTNTLKITDVENKRISINGNVIDLSKKDSSEGLETYLNKVLKEQGINIAAKSDGTNIVLTSDKAGADYKVDVAIVPADAKVSDPSRGAEIIFKDSKGGVYKHTENSNTITLDGVTFKFTGDIPAEGVKVTGKTDTTETKDKLVNFINDYNKLIEKINTFTMEKRDKSFMPLTEEQKKGMSESEVKLWNEKVQKGQLSRDSDLTRIANSMKQAMRTLVEGSSINLEKIGIKPVADYSGVKNGTFTVDENKLTEALETNADEIVNMFTKIKPTNESLSSNQKYVGTGIMQRLKEVLNSEVVTVSSPIIKKAGIEGSSTAYTNDITRSMQKYEQKMKDMERDFSRREQLLYSKYAKLENIMNKYNSQQGYLMQQLGMK